MERFLGFRALCLLFVAIAARAQKAPLPRGIDFECLGNLMTFSFDKSVLWGRSLDIDAVGGTDIIPVTEKVASQCGFSRTSDPWGNTKLYTSVQNCFVQNTDDVFDLTLRFRLSGSALSAAVMHTVSESCTYAAWASREVTCTQNYMEVSVWRRVPTPEITEFNEKGVALEVIEPDEEVEADSLLQLWKVEFHTGRPKTMSIEETRNHGYGVAATLTRLLLRSPYRTAETTSMQVARVPMEVIIASTYIKRKWMVKRLDSAAACPTGGVTFTEEMITWMLPLRISPLLSSTTFNLLAYHLGIDGKRLDAATMEARKYRMTVTDLHIVVEIPLGSVDGYYKSQSPDYQYYITYSIEPMLELLWREDAMHDDTRYKVLFPITTPLMARPPLVIDKTTEEGKVFHFCVGNFLPDVELVNITFETTVLSIAEANSRGFDVHEHLFSNGSRFWGALVPFSDPFVHKGNAAPDVTAYTLQVLFGFVILPENTPFSHPEVLQAYRRDVVLPTVTATCDLEYFYVTVAYGSQGHNFQTVVGQRELTPEIAEEYQYAQNDTHFSITVHFLARDAVFEMVLASLVRSRLNVVLKSLNWNFNDFSLTCSFPMTMIECLSNGTMNALAVKVESVPDLNPSELTLRDPQCKPAYSGPTFALFSFNVNSCGTTRTFVSDHMMYENEISLPRGKATAPADHYMLSVSCSYGISATYTLPFSTKPNPELHVDAATGVLKVQLQLSHDSSYGVFYQAEHYPVVKYLREPLYFEVELMQTTDPNVELFLENCWATSEQDRTSLPKWDLIVDSCENLADPYQTTFHPVFGDARVQFPSHFKRFEVKMFSFTVAGVPLKGQIFVHCDAVICDTNSPRDRHCSRECFDKQNMSMTKRARRAYGQQLKEWVIAGPIVLI
ncbi:hypothetical protein AAFF_G00254080 [Aldrovandia affinis]|uniref:ZP domain-containing protein n=1 Tax=Aldrovandia affinis TaxID=143900 RepID=A0AAD7W2Z1_9TELE|nr:hypothetical protein AAFF_G00254080 [Aldrovandia affinis]